MGAKKIVEPKYLSPATIAAEIDVDADTVRRWIVSGALRAVRMGRFYRVSVEVWEDYKARNFKRVN